MSFPLVPNSVTLRNSANRCVISPNSVAFWADHVKMVGDTLIHCGRNVGQKIKFLVIYHLRRYL